MTSVVSEYMFLECQSEDDASKVVEILQARVDAQADGGAWYPESMEAQGRPGHSGGQLCGPSCRWRQHRRHRQQSLKRCLTSKSRYCRRVATLCGNSL